VLFLKCAARIASGGFSGAFVVLGGFTIGMFYFPSAFLMLMGGLLSAAVGKAVRACAGGWSGVGPVCHRVCRQGA